MWTYLKATAWSSLILLPLLIVGCKSIETYYQGYKAESENTTPLITDKNQQGRWKTFDIDLNYRYDYLDNLLKISGTVDLGFYYKMNASRINKLDAYLFFLDEGGRVLETAALLRSLPFEAEERLSFSREVKVPPGVSAVSFGYDGEAFRDGDGRMDFQDGGGGGGGVQSFYDLPKRVKP